MFKEVDSICNNHIGNKIFLKNLQSTFCDGIITCVTCIVSWSYIKRYFNLIHKSYGWINRTNVEAYRCMYCIEKGSFFSFQKITCPFLLSKTWEGGRKNITDIIIFIFKNCQIFHNFTFLASFQLNTMHVSIDVCF